MFKVEVIKNNVCKYEMFEFFREALKYYAKEVKGAVNTESATIKLYRVCANEKQDLLRECNMIAL